MDDIPMSLVDACKKLRRYLYGEDLRTWRGNINMEGLLDEVQPLLKALAEIEYLTDES